MCLTSWSNMVSWWTLFSPFMMLQIELDLNAPWFTCLTKCRFYLIICDMTRSQSILAFHLFVLFITSVSLSWSIYYKDQFFYGKGFHFFGLMIRYWQFDTNQSYLLLIVKLSISVYLILLFLKAHFKSRVFIAWS